MQTVILLVGYHLGCGVARRSTCRFKELFFFVGVRKAKVDDLDVVVPIEQHVLRFEIAMHDVQTV